MSEYLKAHEAGLELLGRVLLQRRADQAEITELRAKLRATARPSYGTIQLYPEADKPQCPDCGLPVDLPTVMGKHGLELEPIGHDDDGPLYAGTCKAGHVWTYQPYAESDDDSDT